MTDIRDDRFIKELGHAYEELISILEPYTGYDDAYSLVWFSLCEVVMMSDMPIHNDTVGDIMTCIKGNNSCCNDFIYPLERKSDAYEYNRIMEMHGLSTSFETLGISWKKAIGKSDIKAMLDLLTSYDIYTKQLVPFAYEKTVEWEKRCFENEIGDASQKLREQKYSKFIKQMSIMRRELRKFINVMKTVEEFHGLNG